MRTRGVRGAITVDANHATDIHEATAALLRAMVEANAIDAEEIVSVLFTATPDIDAAFPAAAARAIGWTDVPLIDVAEMDVPGALPRCIRVLMTINSEKPQREICHIYLRGARVLRPDIAGAENFSCKER